MPLDPSPSNKAREKNIKHEIDHGKPIKQSVAIGYSEQREAKKEKAKMSEGKMCEEMFSKGAKHEAISNEHLKKPKHAHHGHHEGKNEFKVMAKHTPKLGMVACGNENALKPKMKMGKKK